MTWIVRAIAEKNPRLSVAVAWSIPHKLAPDKLDQILKTRWSGIHDSQGISKN